MRVKQKQSKAYINGYGLNFSKRILIRVERRRQHGRDIKLRDFKVSQLRAIFGETPDSNR